MVWLTGHSKSIAAAQITNRGPVILVQPENEYTVANEGIPFPNRICFQYVEDQLRNAGIVVPLISNDASPDGNLVPGSGKGAVDIYGHDGYPLGFNCSSPSTWPDGALPTDWRMLHEQQSPTTPYSILEFQGGAFDPWGGVGFAKCTSLLNPEFERVFYKNLFSFGVTIFNIYMTYGGTNWGNLGHPQGYTSYDYGAVISEDRTVAREKYSEAKLLANFVQASPAYVTAAPQDNSNANGSFTNSPALAVTQLEGNGTRTNFYVVRHSAYNSYANTKYKLQVTTSAGNVSIPQITGQLSLNGRDSKIHVTDYDVGGPKLLYSSAEIFTWSKNDAGRSILVVYGGPNERHEFAVAGSPEAQVLQGSGLQMKKIKGATVVNSATTPTQRVIKLGQLLVYIVDRNTAYNFWTLPSPSGTVVARAGYLLRNATIQGTSMSLVGDLNATMPLEILSGAPIGLKSLRFNGRNLNFKQDSNGIVTSTLTYTKPQVNVPNLANLSWKYHDGLPEIQPGYDDSAWTNANISQTPNPYSNQTTPTSLYGSDYGYNTGSLIYLGHFKANGKEKTLRLRTQGGSGFGSSIWLNNTFVASYFGNGVDADNNGTFTLPAVQAGKPYALTVVVDNMGLDENYNAGDSGMKNPRGILDYQIVGRPKNVITWKITGNLGGENYRDLARGPLNEGAMYPERQGWHLPKPPSASWAAGKPTTGLSKAGIGFYTTSFDLNVPTGYDTPMSFVFTNTTTAATKNYRVQLFVNGYQFGKYVNHIGPQTVYPVPEGVLNHHGTNYLALTLWAQGRQGAKLSGLALKADGLVQSGYGSVPISPMPAYSKRVGAY